MKKKIYKTAISTAILYEIDCWATIKQHMNKLSIIEMSMLKWICRKTLKDKITNKHIREMVGVALEYKMRKNQIR